MIIIHYIISEQELFSRFLIIYGLYNIINLINLINLIIILFIDSLFIKYDIWYSKFCYWYCRNVNIIP